jgi:hypothetical protein
MSAISRRAHQELELARKRIDDLEYELTRLRRVQRNRNHELNLAYLEGVDQGRALEQQAQQLAEVS